MSPSGGSGRASAGPVGRDGVFELTADGRIVAIHAAAEHARERLREREDQLHEAQRVARLASWTWDPASDRLTIWGAPGEPLSLPFEQALAHAEPADREALRAGLARVARGGLEELVLRHQVSTSDGDEAWVETRARARRDDSGRIVDVSGTTQDVTEPMRSNQAARRSRDFYLATLDSLPSHVVVLDSCGTILATNAAWVRFAAENDGGNSCVGTNYLEVCDASARTEPLAAEAATGLRAVLAGEREQFELEYPCHSPREQRWFQMQATRFTGDGPTRVVVKHENVTDRKLAAHAARPWIARIRDALAEDRFVLFAQPIVDLRTSETVQHELLIRMVTREGELVPPGEFLPAAEQFGLIREIDAWVIRQSAQLAAFGNPVELNLSAESLGDPGTIDVLRHELDESGAVPSRLVIELTETGLLRNHATARAFIARAHALGCRLALDDFGTGYGGFTYLKTLPVDYLKIDVEFVRDLSRNSASRHVVRAVVNLAKGFGQRTIAEGVEDEQTLELLRELGVDLAQGYALGRPAPVHLSALCRG